MDVVCLAKAENGSGIQFQGQTERRRMQAPSSSADLTSDTVNLVLLAIHHRRFINQLISVMLSEDHRCGRALNVNATISTRTKLCTQAD